MNKRLLIITAVFVVGFGVGYGLTWLLIEGPAADGSGAPPAADVQANVATDAASATGSAPPDATSSADSATAAAATSAPAEALVVEDTVSPGSADAAPEAKNQPWWDACYQRHCRMLFGRVTGGISVREGSLSHGAEVDWGPDFGSARKLGVLSVAPDVDVDVHAIGMSKGVPAAAWVTWRGPRKTITGVVSLNIGDKVVKMRPPE